MRFLFILLIFIINTAFATEIKYESSELNFNYKDEYVSYSSKSGEATFDYSILRVGNLSSPSLLSLFNPFDSVSFSPDGLMLFDDKVSLFMLYYPSFASGYSFSFYPLTISFAYQGKGSVSDRLFLDVPSRGGAEALHLLTKYTHNYFSISSKASLSDSNGFDLMLTLSLSYGGLTLSWAEGSVLSFSEDVKNLRRKIAFSIKSKGITYTSSLSFGRDAYLSGSYRFHEGKEKLLLKFDDFELGSTHNSSFSSEGKYKRSTSAYIKWRQYKLGFDSSLKPVIAYDDEIFQAGVENGQFYYGFSYAISGFAFECKLTSKGDLKCSFSLTL